MICSDRWNRPLFSLHSVFRKVFGERAILKVSNNRYSDGPSWLIG